MSNTKNFVELSLPPTFTPAEVETICAIPYQKVAQEAEDWAAQRGIQPATADQIRMAVMPIDMQITFCLPSGELYVGGRTGRGAVEDTERLCGWIYRNLNYVTRIYPTMDTHLAWQIFHAAFWINDQGEHPGPVTMISVEDVRSGKWRVDPAAAATLGKTYPWVQSYVLHYVETLAKEGKYSLTVWPYHAMLGGIGHALVPEFEKAVFFHSLARRVATGFEIKGGSPYTENYSILGPEVKTDHTGAAIGQRNVPLLKALTVYDYVVIAGQAKSHCVAWTIDDLLNWILQEDPKLAQKVYLLEDCTSPVVVPGVIDYTDEADKAFQRFADAGMHLVASTEPIVSWPGVRY